MVTRLLGLFFFLSALAKEVDVKEFAVQITAYGIVREPWLIQAIAFVMILGEAILGVFFLSVKQVGRTIHILTLAILSGFSFMIFYAWHFHNLSDCGCFGSLVSLSPPISIAKNIGKRPVNPVAI